MLLKEATAHNNFNMDWGDFFELFCYKIIPSMPAKIIYSCSIVTADKKCRSVTSS